LKHESNDQFFEIDDRLYEIWYNNQETSKLVQINILDTSPENPLYFRPKFFKIGDFETDYLRSRNLTLLHILNPTRFTQAIIDQIIVSDADYDDAVDHLALKKLWVGSYWRKDEKNRTALIKDIILNAVTIQD